MLAFDPVEHQRIARVRAAHKARLDKDNKTVSFSRNSAMMIPAVLITLAALAPGVHMTATGDTHAGSGFVLLWLGGWTIAVFVLIRSAVSA